MDDWQRIEEMQAVIAEHFLTEDDLVEFLNSDDNEGGSNVSETDAPEPDVPAPDDEGDGEDKAS